ncbi:restriction endonuclease [Streptomyces sp. NPDC090023]|uniref:restriction endonuclease n=1 Tax=unclassified Streptomyces TaxID=2593676 RepID=UPI00382BFCF9
MIIDRHASVTPHRFEAPWLRRTIGKRIGRAGRDDMLHALLLVTEVRTANRTTAAWREFHAELDREIKDAERRRDSSTWNNDQVAVGCRAAAGLLADKLWTERQGALESLTECEAITTRLSRRLGITLIDDSCDTTDARAALAALNDYLVTARQQLTTLLTEDRAALHSLAWREVRKHNRTSELTPTITQIDAMDQNAFEDAVQQRLERSGFRVTSRQSKALFVTRKGERGLVYCVTVPAAETDIPTPVREIAAAQRLAESRELSAVLIVTNQRFISQPAERYRLEANPSVELMQRTDLQRWIEWGMSLREALAED